MPSCIACMPRSSDAELQVCPVHRCIATARARGAWGTVLRSAPQWLPVFGVKQDP